MNLLDVFELCITVVAVGLTGINWLISQRLSNLEHRTQNLEEFQKKSQDEFKILHKIEAKIDFLLKTKHP